MTLRHAVSLSIALSAAACGEPPSTTGSDQVADDNVAATALKDNGLAAQSWPAVDNYVSFNWGIDPDGPGCAVGIAQGGELTYLQGYGKAEIGGQDWSVATMGAVGSVSKTFTAAAIFRMHELGMLDVNDRVGDYLTTSNGPLANARIYNLLSHTSGVGGDDKGKAFAPNWTADSNADACAGSLAPECLFVWQQLAHPREAFEQYQEGELVEPIDEDDGLPKEGVYSNVGYSVLGAIIDRLAGDEGSGYERWIWDNIGQYAGPLSVDNLLTLALTHSWRATDIPNRAVGSPLEAWQNTDVIEGWEGPAGGWAMTIGDLTRFAVALNTQQIVNGSSLAAMRFEWADLDDIGNNVGMGVMLGTPGSDQPPYWHGGIIGGHTAAWTWWPNKDGQSLAVALICNRSDVDFGPFDLRDHAAEIADRIDNTPQPIQVVYVPIDPSRIDRRRYHLDIARSWQSQPARVLLPLTALRDSLALQVDRSGPDIALSLVHGKRSTFLGVVPLDNPRFTSRPTDVTLATSVGELTVYGMVVDGAFASRGDAIAGVGLRGTLDGRQVSQAVGMSPSALCSMVAGSGGACEPCTDGAPVCLGVSYESLDGAAMSGLRR
jgi:CubicO group peptidase (beta-lactamase class C family)